MLQLFTSGAQETGQYDQGLQCLYLSNFGTHCNYDCCALCQEHREFRSRGLDPSLGWEADRVNHVQPMWWNERSRVVMAAAERNN